MASQEIARLKQNAISRSRPRELDENQIPSAGLKKAPPSSLQAQTPSKTNMFGNQINSDKYVPLGGAGLLSKTPSQTKMFANALNGI